MKTIRLLTFAVICVVSVFALLLPGCATKPDVRADYDHAADFAKYRTFNFASPLSTDKLGYSSLVTQQLKSAVTAQMQQRGYQLSPNPDLLVNFSGRLKEKQDVQSMPTAGPYYGYRAGFYGTWAGYGNEVYTVNYTEGTLNVDLIDARRMQMVWEGVAVGEVTKAALKDRDAAINKAVTEVFTQFPFRAGTATPISTAEK
jgi:uncharacterized protein DUF4136